MRRIYRGSARVLIETLWGSCRGVAFRVWGDFCLGFRAPHFRALWFLGLRVWYVYSVGAFGV